MCKSLDIRDLHNYVITYTNSTIMNYMHTDTSSGWCNKSCHQIPPSGHALALFRVRVLPYLWSGQAPLIRASMCISRTDHIYADDQSSHPHSSVLRRDSELPLSYSLETCVTRFNDNADNNFGHLDARYIIYLCHIDISRCNKLPCKVTIFIFFCLWFKIIFPSGNLNDQVK